MAQSRPAWDVIVVGAGPAGMSASLILGRCQRRVLLTDSGTPRNGPAHRMHGYLSQDGMQLDAFRASARSQLAAYPSVELRPLEVTAVERAAMGGFDVALADGARERCRKVLLASGVFDEVPQIPGIERYYGTTVHPCPYCEGWEMRDRPTAVYGKGSRGFEMARAMTAWSSDLTLCTDGPAHLSPKQRLSLEANGIEVITERITGLGGDDGQLQSIKFKNGDERRFRALFFDTPCHSQSPLARALGCRMTRSGKIRCGRYEATTVPGVYAAGNVLNDVQLSIVAAADGARAAFGINVALTREDFQQPVVAGNGGRHRVTERPAVPA